jgi:hypothetical protein
MIYARQERLWRGRPYGGETGLRLLGGQQTRMRGAGRAGFEETLAAIQSDPLNRFWKSMDTFQDRQKVERIFDSRRPWQAPTPARVAAAGAGGNGLDR